MVIAEEKHNITPATHARQGFALIELLVYIAIIGVLASGAMGFINI